MTIFFFFFRLSKISTRTREINCVLMTISIQTSKKKISKRESFAIRATVPHCFSIFNI